MVTERQITPPPGLEPTLGRDARSIARDIVAKLYLELAKFPGVATRNDHYLALAYAVRDRVLSRWARSSRAYLDGKHRTVVYLSAEYLIGPQLDANLLVLGIEAEVRAAAAELGLSLDELIEHEEEPGLGNGGLGRLAACFMDSLATVAVPAIGHGLRYEFGIFDQAIRDGWQVERTDRWLRHGNPWEVRRHDVEYPVGFGGHTESYVDVRGHYRVRWHPERQVLGVPYDTPVPGYGTGNTNTLRLWSAMAAEDFDLGAFQRGEYWRAVESKIQSENLTKVVYPADHSAAGKQLRLEQEYFFVSCALQDCIRMLTSRTSIHAFADVFAIQLNDTHPSLAVPELMRLLIDVHDLSWEEAWRITQRAISYTNHTLMPEALEVWPLRLVQRLLPRHLDIIYEINRRFLDEVRARFPGDDARLRRMSLIGEDGERTVRMANLATVASHAVNGVAELHTTLLKQTVLRDFAELWPDRFVNVTNGVTPRRFVALSNRPLAALITEAIGDAWLTDLDRLVELEKFADDAGFRDRWRTIKRGNRHALSHWLRATGPGIDPDAMLDAHCKRIHEYKRQLLNALRVIWLWDRARAGADAGDVPRTVLFAGKAAPSYWMAKQVIRLIHGVADVVEADPATRADLRVVFVPDFNVKTAQRIYPATDLSEQISLAGTEASGTGNMKFMLNGALTIGTLDGANIEIREAVGERDFFTFGLTAAEVTARRLAGYSPREELERDPELAELVEHIAEGAFTRGDREALAPLVASLVDHDPFMVLADFRAYLAAQRAAADRWRDVEAWTRASIRNVAHGGRFSSDRSIREYQQKIWRVPAVPIAAE